MKNEIKNIINWLNNDFDINYTVKDFPNDINEKNWTRISRYRILSEKFIERYKNKLNWIIISRYQILSEKFIEKYRNKID